MSGSSAKVPWGSQIKRNFRILVVLWTFVVSGLFINDVRHIQQMTEELAIAEARAYASKDQATRLWAASHGGVYVSVSDVTPPNPFLAHVPDRDIHTPSGRALTVMNPAYMIRQIMEYYADHWGGRGHLTSLNYFRQETAPDEWESAALVSFESGVKEVCEFSEVKGLPYFRLMRPLILRKSSV